MLITKALDLLYPRVCPLCGELSDRKDRYICWDCLSKFELYSPEEAHCSRCGLIPEGHSDHEFICDACKDSPPHYDIARHAVRYTDDIKRLVHELKYKKHTYCIKDFGDLLEATLRSSFDLTEIDFIAPIPLHPVKYMLRTYNQAELLARELARRVKIPMRHRLIERVEDTLTQTRLSATRRRENTHNAFNVAMPEYVRSRTILLIDDVMTTGATLDEVAWALKSSGADNVYSLTLARGRVNN